MLGGRIDDVGALLTSDVYNWSDCKGVILWIGANNLSAWGSRPADPPELVYQKTLNVINYIRFVLRKPVGVFGLVFRPGQDDVNESISRLNKLLEKAAIQQCKKKVYCNTV